jgi:ABC-type polysaccharide/polyol phosphate transport system ATPase subunit
MGEVAIQANGLGKKYRIVHRRNATSDSFVGSMGSGIKNLFSRESTSTSYEEFWALRDLSFTINKGDRVGVIGRNGAGKSTLLKLLSRIVTPSTGSIEYEGTMASLLEVGTGFHGDLSGRENIFLNGSILGMRRSEIEKRLDEIISFSEVEQFIDMPVKRYSSGMYVKLAFSVAAHLTPDILILDEVLAVGDAAFQKKCITKVNELSRSEGRTVLFVSHNVSSVRSICNKGLYLEAGRLEGEGPVDKMILKYQSYLKDKVAKGIIVEVKPISASGEWEVGTNAEVTVKWERHRYAPGWQCDIACYSFDGVKVFALQSHAYPGFSSSDPECSGITFMVKNVGFPASDMRLDVGIRKHTDESYDIVIENCAVLSPSDKSLYLYARQDVIIVPESSCQPLIT